MRKWFVIFLLLVTPLAYAEDQESRLAEQALNLLSATSRFQQVAISPDGTQVAWVQNPRRDGERRTSIYVVNLRKKEEPRLITASPDATWENQIAWSPDSKQIAFLSNAGDWRQQQLYVVNLDCKASPNCVRRLTNITATLSSPSWSPDGNSLALLVIENAPRSPGPLQPMTPPSGVIDENLYEQRLNVVAVATGSIRAVSPKDMYVYEYDWMSDSRGFVLTAAHGNGDGNWWLAQLYTLDLAGELRSLYKPKWQISNPQVSPDGRSVAFISGLMSDQGVTGGDVYVVPISGGEARNLTPNMPSSATWLAWSGGDRLLFAEIADGNSGLAEVDTKGKLTQMWSAPESITDGYDVGLSLSEDGRQSAFIRSSGQQPPEIWAGPIGAWTQLTKDFGKTHLLWGELRSIHWQSDKYRVQGWLLFPYKYKASKRYPLIVNVHGGPAAACTAGWPNTNDAPFAAEGYFVLCPNPRGSFGQGEVFTQANIKDLGGGDFRDIMAGVDEVLREFPIDPRQIGIKGWSYGGYMTMWAETQTQRFAAAVAGAGISNWVSYYGQNDIDQWMIPYFGASVYDDPAVYAKTQPINFVKQVKTPTLILVGDRDGECPAPQSFEWWHALKTFNIPVQLVVYPDEGHAIQQSEHRHDVVTRTLGWFDQYMRGKAAASAAAPVTGSH